MRFLFIWYLEAFRLHSRGGRLHTQTWGPTQGEAVGFSPGFPTWRTAAGASSTWKWLVHPHLFGDIGPSWPLRKWVKKLNWDCILRILGKPLLFGEWARGGNGGDGRASFGWRNMVICSCAVGLYMYFLADWKIRPVKMSSNCAFPWKGFLRVNVDKWAWIMGLD